MRHLITLMIAAFVTVMISCEGPRTFKIKGEISGGVTTNLYVKYYGNDAVQTGVTAARDGKFEAEFSSAEPTIVEILDNDYRVLARLFLKNGDEVNVTIDRNNPNNNTVIGSEINEQWAALLNANAQLLASGDNEKINEMVEDYISAHPDQLLSTLMFVVFYDYSIDPVRSDSVVSLIDEDVRLTSVLSSYATQIRRFADPMAYGVVQDIRYRGLSSDSVRVFAPKGRRASLLVFTNENCHRADSIVPSLKQLQRDYSASKFKILDIVLYNDTTSWKFACRRDSATWEQGWVPGGLLANGIDQLAIPRMPYYIVTDSAGKQRYRGESAAGAKEAIKALINP